MRKLDVGQILTVPEMARLKRVTSAAVYLAIAKRKLAHVRLLGRIGVRRDDADAWRPPLGRPKGIPMSGDAKRRISATQKRRWQARTRKRAAA